MTPDEYFLPEEGNQQQFEAECDPEWIEFLDRLEAKAWKERMEDEQS